MMPLRYSIACISCRNDRPFVYIGIAVSLRPYAARHARRSTDWTLPVLQGTQSTGLDGVLNAALHGDGGRLVLGPDAGREIGERIGARQVAGHG